MSVKVHKQEGIVVVRFEDRELVTDEQVMRTSNDLSVVLDSTSAGTRLLLDFKNVDIVASMMLGDLVGTYKKALRKGVVLQFFGLSSNVKRVIATSKLDQLFDILDAPPSTVM